MTEQKETRCGKCYECNQWPKEPCTNTAYTATPTEGPEWAREVLKTEKSYTGLENGNYYEAKGFLEGYKRGKAEGRSEALDDAAKVCEDSIAIPLTGRSPSRLARDIRALGEK